MYPGPPIEANVEDRIVVNVTNLMPNATTVSQGLSAGRRFVLFADKPGTTQIHWHGLYQRGTPYYDGTNGITQVRRVLLRSRSAAR